MPVGHNIRSRRTFGRMNKYRVDDFFDRAERFLLRATLFILTLLALAKFIWSEAAPFVNEVFHIDPRQSRSQLEHPQYTPFHFLGLAGRLVKHGLKINPAMLPGHIDCFSHGISHHDELGGPSVVMPPKCHDVGLERHSGVET